MAGDPVPGSTAGGAVVVIGAVNVDLVVVTPTLPAPGETVSGSGLQVYGGGKGANAAVAAARAGAMVRLVAAVGADDNGRRALAELEVEGIDVSGVAVIDGQPTGVALIVVDAKGENQIALGPGANGQLPADHVAAALSPTALATVACVLVSTEIPGDAVLAAVSAAAAAGVPCLLNPAPVIPAVVEALGFGPILTPNSTELAQLIALLSPGPDRAGPDPAVVDPADPAVVDSAGAGPLAGPDPTDNEAALVGLAHRTQAAAVVTVGSDGCLVAWPDGSTGRVPARTVEVRDTTGAGDTFNGVLAARLAAGADLRAAIATAVVAASLSVTGVGARTAMPTEHEIESALSG